MYRVLLGGLCWCFRLLPVPLAVALGRGLGWCLQHVVRFRRRVVALQLRLAFGRDHDAAALAALTTGVYRHLGLLFVELLRLPGITRDRVRQTIDVRGEEHLQAALAAGKGVLLLAGHLGNWELAGLALPTWGYAAAAIGKEMKHPAGDVLRRMLRDDNGFPTIPRRDSLKLILRELKANHIVVVLIDQNMTAAEGVFVDFFGYPACTLKALAVLAARTGAAVVPGAICRLPDLRRHRVELLPALPPPLASGDAEADLQRRTQQYTRVLEDLIRQHPDQWLWIHKRWRTRPAGEPAGTIDYRRG